MFSCFIADKKTAQGKFFILNTPLFQEGFFSLIDLSLEPVVSGSRHLVCCLGQWTFTLATQQDQTTEDISLVLEKIYLGLAILGINWSHI